MVIYVATAILLYGFVKFKDRKIKKVIPDWFYSYEKIKRRWR